MFQGVGNGIYDVKHFASCVLCHKQLNKLNFYFVKGLHVEVQARLRKPKRDAETLTLDIQTDNLSRLHINGLLWSCRALPTKELPYFHCLPPVGRGFLMSRIGTCNMCKLGWMCKLGKTWEGMMESIKNFKDRCCHYYIKPEDHFILRANYQSHSFGCFLIQARKSGGWIKNISTLSC